MVKVLIGNLFESKAQTLVNTVNCVGVMGKGVALHFRERFPEMFTDYVKRCERKEVRLGEPYLYRRVVEPWILNFPTKDHWRSVARLSDIERGLQYLLGHYKSWGISSLAVPPLGCGEGQLEWKVVGPTLHRWLSRLDIPVELFAPFGTPESQMEPAYLERAGVTSGARVPSGRMNPGWVALVEILDRIEKERYHHPVGRTAFQKLAYFATQRGIDTGLAFQRGSYGPFSSELKNTITRLVNHGLIREERLGRMFAVQPGRTFKDARDAYSAALREWTEAIDKVTDLFLRLDTERAETVATVHFAALSLEKRGQAPTESEVLQEVLNWKQRRRPPLPAGEIASAIRHLAMLRWIDVRASADLPVSEEALIGA
jgi:O-acetyl-ADP-ribose deacetylase (regulator of RNase III)